MYLSEARRRQGGWPRRGSRCDGHGSKTEGESPLQALLEGIEKHMQLHECQEVSDLGHLFARTCGVEANCEPQHRMQVNSRKAVRHGLARRGVRRPISRRGRMVVRAAAAGSLGLLPHESSLGPEYRSTGQRCSVYARRYSGVGFAGRLRAIQYRNWRSDRLVVALRPGNAGGAKGTTC